MGDNTDDINWVIFSVLKFPPSTPNTQKPALPWLCAVCLIYIPWIKHEFGVVLLLNTAFKQTLSCIHLLYNFKHFSLFHEYAFHLPSIKSCTKCFTYNNKMKCGYIYQFLKPTTPPSLSPTYMYIHAPACTFLHMRKKVAYMSRHEAVMWSRLQRVPPQGPLQPGQTLYTIAIRTW